MKVILASTSKYRKAQLKALGIKFISVSPLVNEDHLKQKKASPLKIAKTIAKEKAISVAKMYPDAIVIGADQLIALNNKILGKPKNYKNAVKQLSLMSGRKHKLITAVTLAHKKRHYTRVNVATIKMRRLTQENIKKYLHLDKPYDCAGSYKFEKAGLSLVKNMRMTDPSALIGLPLISVCELMERLKS